MYQTKTIPDPSSLNWETMESELNEWCKYHKIKGHTEKYHQWKKEIEFITQKVHLRIYVQGTPHNFGRNQNILRVIVLKVLYEKKGRSSKLTSNL